MSDLLANRRSVMTLFTHPTSPDCHRTRIVLAEKHIQAEVIEVREHDIPEDLANLNPYSSTPTLVDRELTLYDSRVITDYLDERFPHPPLMPVDPVTRAQFRLMLYRIERDWYQTAREIDRAKDTRTANRYRKQLTESLVNAADMFMLKPFFMSDEYTLVDASILPILWRLDHYQIELPKEAQAIVEYAKRQFIRAPFKASLSELEVEMRPQVTIVSGSL